MPPTDSHPYVDSVTITGNQLTLSVEVTDFMGKGGGLEISGQATQNGGAFATFSQIKQVADATEGDRKGEYFVEVTADTIPPYRFMKDQDVTVFVRTSRVWVTVLGVNSTQGSQPYETGQVADDNTKWELRRSSQLDGTPWPQATAT